MAATIEIVGLLILNPLLFGLGLWLTLRCGLSPRDKAEKRYRQAASAVDDIFYQARIAMEEAAGKRQPGEHRVEDGLSGSWKDVL